MNIVLWKQEFLHHLKTQRGRSVKTVENYDRYLDRFLVFSRVETPADICVEQVNKFRTYLTRQPGIRIGSVTKPMKQKTQNYHLIALRSFFRYLRQREIPVIAPEQIALSKILPHSLEVLTASEIKQLQTAPDTKSAVGMRDKAIIEILVGTGMRISELCELSISDVDFISGACGVTGTGNRNRTVFLTTSASQSLQQYLKSRQDFDTALFVRYGRKANDGGNARIQPRAVQRLLKQYGVTAGITRRVTPHVIRHSFAINLLQSGTDTQSLQVLLGHTSNSMTDRYMHEIVESKTCLE